MVKETKTQQNIKNNEKIRTDKEEKQRTIRRKNKDFWKHSVGTIKTSIVKFWQAKKQIYSGLQLINEHLYPFWGLDVGAIKSSIANFWQAKQEIFIDVCFITGMLTLVTAIYWNHGVSLGIESLLRPPQSNKHSNNNKHHEIASFLLDCTVSLCLKPPPKPRMAPPRLHLELSG